MKRQKSLSVEYEQKKIQEGFSFVIGCDEVGRGCLAGPVVAAAVMVDPSKWQQLSGVRDSKLLNAKQREGLDSVIKENALAWGIGSVSEKVIDEINIHQASLLAMRQAVGNLLARVSSETRKVFLYLDGKFTIPNFELRQEAVVDGDAKVLSVAAASIVAKVFRDTYMQELHVKFPEYAFGQHKGYATQLHRDAIRKHGLTPLHRLSFCAQYIERS